MTVYQMNSERICPEVLEKEYLQELDSNIVKHIACQRNIAMQDALELYYSSKLCEYIHEGKYDIQYLDYKLLAEDYLF